MPPLFVTIRIIKFLVVAGVLVLLVSTALIADTHPTAMVTSASPVQRGYKGTSAHGLSVAKFRYLKRTAGMTWFRDDALWSDVEPERGVFRWSRLDKLFRNARAAKVNVLLIIDYSTSWSGTPPRSNADYADFAGRVADRYHDFGGSLAFEFWNEPYMSWTWGGQRPDPVKYAGMVRAAATAVRGRRYGIALVANVDPRNYADGSNYFDEFLEADPTIFRSLDAWSVHAYAANCSPLADLDGTCTKLKRDWRFDRIARVQSIAKAHGASRPIWVTEFGWSTCTDDPDECVTERQQAAYTALAIRRARNDWGVQRLFVHTGDRDGTGPDKESRYGMFRPDGTDKPIVAAIGRAS